MAHSVNATWKKLTDEVRRMAETDEAIACYLHAAVLDHSSLERALAYILSSKLASIHIAGHILKSLFEILFSSADLLTESVCADLDAIVNRDPAARGLAGPFLHSKGFHALEAYRMSHVLWKQGRHGLALYLNNRTSEVFAVDIHPAARIGKGILIDHATGVVIGETAVVEDDVSMLHEVTLGGTGKEQGDRHPKIGRGVLIGAGAKILGNVRIGEGSKIGAGSVVLGDVPPHCTVAGVPARIVGHPKTNRPALSMDQSIDLDDQVFSSYGASML